jgi:hypothetical protein
VNRKRELTRDFIGDLNPFNLNGYPIPKQSYTRSRRLASDA